MNGEGEVGGALAFLAYVGVVVLGALLILRRQAAALEPRRRVLLGGALVLLVSGLGFAIPVWISQFEPGDEQDEARNAAVFLVLVIATAIVILIRTRSGERPAPRSLWVAFMINVVCGLFALVPGAAHTIAVLIVTFREGAAEYDFDRYAAALYGAVWSALALACLLWAKGLLSGDRSAWWRVMASSLGLVAVNAPVIVLNSGAAIPLICGGVNALSLVGTRLWHGRISSAYGTRPQ